MCCACTSRDLRTTGRFPAPQHLCLVTAVLWSGCWGCFLGLHGCLALLALQGQLDAPEEFLQTPALVFHSGCCLEAELTWWLVAMQWLILINHLQISLLRMCSWPPACYGSLLGACLKTTSSLRFCECFRKKIGHKCMLPEPHSWGEVAKCIAGVNVVGWVNSAGTDTGVWSSEPRMMKKSGEQKC